MKSFIREAKDTFPTVSGFLLTTRSLSDVEGGLIKKPVLR